MNGSDSRGHRAQWIIGAERSPFVGPELGARLKDVRACKIEVARDITGDGVPQSHSVTEKEGRWIL